MKKEVKKFTVNYNGEAIKPGETMVPFPCSDLDVKYCVNKECVKTVKQGGKQFRVIYKAVPDEWAKVANSALNLVENEELGHYGIPNSVSLDELRDEYELEKAVAESAEDMMMKSERLREAKETFVYHASRLITANPKVGYAALLVYREIKGKEFYTKLRLNQPAASRVRHQAEDILSRGLLYFDADELHGYKSRLDETYREEALALLEEIISEIM